MRTTHYSRFDVEILFKILYNLSRNKFESDDKNADIAHTYPLSKIDEAYDLFESKKDGVIKVAVDCQA